MHYQNDPRKPAMVVHLFNPSTEDSEASGSL